MEAPSFGIPSTNILGQDNGLAGGNYFSDMVDSIAYPGTPAAQSALTDYEKGAKDVAKGVVGLAELISETVDVLGNIAKNFGPFVIALIVIAIGIALMQSEGSRSMSNHIGRIADSLTKEASKGISAAEIFA